METSSVAPARRPAAAPNPARARFSADRLLLVGASLLAAIVYAILLPTAGYERDLFWFDSWMRTGVDEGVAQISALVWCDYPPGLLYLLSGLGHLWTIFTGLPLLPVESPGQRVLLKLIPLAANILTAWVLYRVAILQRRPPMLRAAVYAVALLNPALVFNSAVWGQADSLVGLLLLWAALAVASGRAGLGFAVLTAAILTKAQAFVVLPLFVLAIWNLAGRAGLWAAGRGAFFSALVLLAPFYWAGRVDSVVDAMLTANGRYPNVSMDALNLWWLVGGTASSTLSDATRVGNALLSYWAIGMLLFGAVTALILWRLQRALTAGSEDSLYAILEATALQGLAFYLFPTEMHERYIVPIVPLLAALCLWKRRAWGMYLTLSVAILVSLGSTLQHHYRGNAAVLAPLFLPERAETTMLACIFLSAFAVMLLWTPDRRFRLMAPAVAALFALALAAVALMPMRGGVQPLTDWNPIAQSQGWGRMQRNASVEGRRIEVFGLVFREGIGTHAPSRLTYDLNGAFRSFDTAFGIDDEANRGQRMQFRVLADGQVRFDSGVIFGFAMPRQITIDVSGTQELTLEVLDGGDSINSDHADWLHPILRRSPP